MQVIYNKENLFETIFGFPISAPPKGFKVIDIKMITELHMGTFEPETFKVEGPIALSAINPICYQYYMISLRVLFVNVSN